MKTAIVLGATGLVGRNLVSRLIEERCFEKILAVTRRPVEYKSEKVVNEVINFDELDSYSDVFNGDVLFSCLGTTRKQAGSFQRQRQVDFEYQYLAAKLSAQNAVPHYVLVSSSGANANSKSPYFKMKGELEQEVLSLPFKRISILQPSLLVGERADMRLGETLASWILPVLCTLPLFRRYRPILGDEVAGKMVSLSLLPGKGIEIFTLDEVFM